jgi:hypothetical protein
MATQPVYKRKHGKIDDLPAELKDAVEQMLLSNCRYSEVVDFLADKGISISLPSICRYAKNYHANVQLLNIAQENMKRMMGEIDKYPGLDTTEAIVRLMSQNVFNALANLDEDDLALVDVDKLLREANGLIKAAAYKKRIDLQNKSVTDAGMDAVKQMVFDAMARERPELYAQVVGFLEAKKGSLAAAEETEA